MGAFFRIDLDVFGGIDVRQSARGCRDIDSALWGGKAFFVPRIQFEGGLFGGWKEALSDFFDALR